MRRRPRGGWGAGGPGLLRNSEVTKRRPGRRAGARRPPLRPDAGAAGPRGPAPFAFGSASGLGAAPGTRGRGCLPGRPGSCSTPEKWINSSRPHLPSGFPGYQASNPDGFLPVASPSAWEQPPHPAALWLRLLIRLLGSGQKCSVRFARPRGVDVAPTWRVST